MCRQDIHCYGIMALAAKCGFHQAEAELLGYASQYTDDATEHKPILVDGAGDLGAVDGRFDPVCSASAGIGYVAGTRPEVQRKVYVAFHFVPPRPKASGPFRWVVEPDGDLIRARVKSLCLRLRSLPPGDERAQTLLALGIALHSYSDQWSHEWFSGRWHRENDVEDVAIDGKKISFVDQVKQNLIPDIGHAELLSTPDDAATTFSFWAVADRVRRQRSNPTAFLKMAQAVYEHLALAQAGALQPWFSFGAALHRCLASRGTAEQRTAAWSRLAGFPVAYDPLRWRREALTGGEIAWDRWQHPDEFLAHRYKATGAPEWFWWHAAARQHRSFVLGLIPADLS